jgi:hypothetical protein
MGVMLSRLWATAAVTLTLVGCGGAGPHSTDPAPVTATREGDLAPHVWSCAIEFFPIDAEVSAKITPASLYMELRAGACDSPGTMVGASLTGMLKVTVPRGAYHLNVGNPGDVRASYSLTVQYLAPSI